MADDTSLDPTEEALRDADAAGRVRARMLLLLGTLVVVWVFAKGLSLYERLPERLPTHFGLGGAPDAWGPKSIFNVFGPLIIAAVMLLAMALLRGRPQWYNFPGKEKALRLPPDQQSHVYAPLQESLAWLAASLATGLSLVSQQSWAVALHARRAISPTLILVPFVVGLAAVLVATLVATRRLRSLD